jgi:cytochrome c553
MTSILLATCLAVGQSASLGQTESLTMTGTGVVLTDGGQLHEGRIDRLGDFVRIMSGGRTTMLRSANIAFTGDTKLEAYEYLRTKRKSDSASDAAGLADWCRKHGLMKEAVAEARTAVRLAPDDRGIAKLALEIEDDAKRPRPVMRIVGAPAPPAKAVVSSSKPVAAVPTMPRETPVASVVPAALEQSFAKSVQAVLMNACANCHADPNRAVSFRLARIPEGISQSPKTAENAVAAFRMVNPAQPAASPLVTYALTPHGGRRSAPLQRGTTAVQNLETWAMMAARAMPAPANPREPLTAAAPMPEATPSPTMALPSLIVPPPAPVPVESVAAPAPIDPFDPVQFNKASPGRR